jgi:apolipoprotein D and lipocalin family protein
MIRRLLHVATALTCVSCSMRDGGSPPPTVSSVDLKRYAGRWYEIARLPTPFQKDNESAIADYGVNADGTLSVHNIAVRPDGSQRSIKGVATSLNPPQHTKLAVRFKTWFGPLIPMPKEGNYWILYRDNDYQEAVVGTASRKFLWILARTPEVSDQRYQRLTDIARSAGYDTTRLIRTSGHSGH